MRRHDQAGLTLVELMVAMTISLLLLLVMVNVYVNLSRTNDEMAKTNSMIENGRFAIQILENDLEHVGYWAGFVPQFDDLTASTIPSDAPSSIPDVCATYATWTGDYKSNLLGISIQSSDTLPSGAGCSGFPAKRAVSDVVVVRHAETCIPGGTNCDADTAGRVYMQTSNCAAEKNAGTVVSAASNTIVFPSSASSANGAYAGVTLQIVSGTGMGQLRNISSYNGTTRTAILSTPWATIPDGTSVYAFEYALGTSAYPLHKRDCVGTGTPATLPLTAGTVADKRRLISNIYYIADYAHPDRPGETVPTLVRSQLDVVGGTPVQSEPVRLLDGVEAVRVELGIDNVSKTGNAVNYTQAVDWVDAATKTQPKNRGDGSPDLFKRCTTAAPCDAADLSNVVAVKLYVLARSRETSPGYTDTKQYCLGEPEADGSCSVANTIAAANDHYKRHVFTTSVRLNNISGLRETPDP
ncbi:MAG: PilW family protein [Steroidobacteraceae bacterium]